MQNLSLFPPLHMQRRRTCTPHMLFFISTSVVCDIIMDLTSPESAGKNKKEWGPNPGSNRGSLAPKASILPLDHWA